MNRAEFVDALAEKTGQTKAATKAVVDAFLETVSDELAAGRSVDFVGFGSFKTKERAARTSKNPQTGNPVAIPAKRVPVFAAGKKLKDSTAG